MHSIKEVENILLTVLNLGEQRLRPESPLLGSIPELDSMAVINIITALEDHFGITINDDEISAETFESLGKLSSFIDDKLTQ